MGLDSMADVNKADNQVGPENPEDFTGYLLAIIEAHFLLIIFCIVLVILLGIVIGCSLRIVKRVNRKLSHIVFVSEVFKKICDDVEYDNSSCNGVGEVASKGKRIPVVNEANVLTEKTNPKKRVKFCDQAEKIGRVSSPPPEIEINSQDYGNSEFIPDPKANKTLKEIEDEIFQVQAALDKLRSQNLIYLQREGNLPNEPKKFQQFPRNIVQSQNGGDDESSQFNNSGLKNQPSNLSDADGKDNHEQNESSPYNNDRAFQESEYPEVGCIEESLKDLRNKNVSLEETRPISGFPEKCETEPEITNPSYLISSLEKEGSHTCQNSGKAENVASIDTMIPLTQTDNTADSPFSDNTNLDSVENSAKSDSKTKKNLSDSDDKRKPNSAEDRKHIKLAPSGTPSSESYRIGGIKNNASNSTPIDRENGNAPSSEFSASGSSHPISNGRRSQPQFGISPEIPKGVGENPIVTDSTDPGISGCEECMRIEKLALNSEYDGAQRIGNDLELHKYNGDDAGIKKVVKVTQKLESPSPESHSGQLETGFPAAEMDPKRPPTKSLGTDKDKRTEDSVESKRNRIGKASPENKYQELNILTMNDKDTSGCAKSGEDQNDNPNELENRLRVDPLSLHDFQESEEDALKFYDQNKETERNPLADKIHSDFPKLMEGNLVSSGSADLSEVQSGTQNLEKSRGADDKPKHKIDDQFLSASDVGLPTDDLSDTSTQLGRIHNPNSSQKSKFGNQSNRIISEAQEPESTKPENNSLARTEISKNNPINFANGNVEQNFQDGICERHKPPGGRNRIRKLERSVSVHEYEDEAGKSESNYPDDCNTLDKEPKKPSAQYAESNGGMNDKENVELEKIDNALNEGEVFVVDANNENHEELKDKDADNLIHPPKSCPIENGEDNFRKSHGSNSKDYISKGPEDLHKPESSNVVQNVVFRRSPTSDMVESPNIKTYSQDDKRLAEHSDGDVLNLNTIPLEDKAYVGQGETEMDSNMKPNAKNSNQNSGKFINELTDNGKDMGLGDNDHEDRVKETPEHDPRNHNLVNNENSVQNKPQGFGEALNAKTYCVDDNLLAEYSGGDGLNTVPSKVKPHWGQGETEIKLDSNSKILGKRPVSDARHTCGKILAEGDGLTIPFLEEPKVGHHETEMKMDSNMKPNTKDSNQTFGELINELNESSGRNMGLGDSKVRRIRFSEGLVKESSEPEPQNHDFVKNKNSAQSNPQDLGPNTNTNSADDKRLAEYSDGDGLNTVPFEEKSHRGQKETDMMNPKMSSNSRISNRDLGKHVDLSDNGKGKGLGNSKDELGNSSQVLEDVSLGKSPMSDVREASNIQINSTGDKSLAEYSDGNRLNLKSVPLEDKVYVGQNETGIKMDSDNNTKGKISNQNENFGKLSNELSDRGPRNQNFANIENSARQSEQRGLSPSGHETDHKSSEVKSSTPESSELDTGNENSIPPNSNSNSKSTSEPHRRRNKPELTVALLLCSQKIGLKSGLFK